MVYFPWLERSGKANTCGASHTVFLIPSLFLFFLAPFSSSVIVPMALGCKRGCAKMEIQMSHSQICFYLPFAQFIQCSPQCRIMENPWLIGFRSLFLLKRYSFISCSPGRLNSDHTRSHQDHSLSLFRLVFVPIWVHTSIGYPQFCQATNLIPLNRIINWFTSEVHFPFYSSHLRRFMRCSLVCHRSPWRATCHTRSVAHHFPQLVSCPVAVIMQ